MQFLKKYKDIGYFSSVVFFIWAITIGTVLIFLIQWNHLLYGDEGIILNGALKLYSGSVYGQDFIEIIAPGSFWLVSVAFIIFGASYVSAKLVSIIFLLISLVVFYFVNKLIGLSYKLSFLSTTIWLIISGIGYSLINHNSFSSFLSVIVLYVVIQLLVKKKSFWVFTSGTLTGVVFLFLQTKGIFLALALVIYFLFLFPEKSSVRRKYAIFFVVSFCAVVCAGILFWGGEFVYAPLKYSLQYLQTNKYFWVSWLFVWFIFLFFYILVLLKSQDETRGFVHLLGVVQTALLLSVVNLPDFHHILIVVFPMVVLFFLYVKDVWTFVPYKALIKILLYLFTVIIFLSLIIRFIDNQSRTQKTTRMLSEVKSTISSGTLFAYPFAPGIYLELGKENKYIVSAPELMQDFSPFIDSLIIQLNHERPKYIFYSFTNGAVMFYPSKIDRFRDECYELKRIISGGLLYEINDKCRIDRVVN